jgi:hypothetical protein
VDNHLDPEHVLVPRADLHRVHFHQLPPHHLLPPPRIVLRRVPGPENRGGPCRVRQRLPPTGLLPAKTGPAPSEVTSGASGARPG